MRALVRASDSNEVSLPKYPILRAYKLYSLSEEGDSAGHAKVNPELVSQLSTRGEPRASVSQNDLVRLERALLTVRNTQIFLSWILGAFFSLTLSKDKATHGALLQQFARSIEMALMHQIQLTSFAIANTRAIRRESCLSQLQSHFSSTARAQLRRSDVDSELLFETARVNTAVEQAQQAMSVSVTEAAARSLLRSNTVEEEYIGRPFTFFLSYECSCWFFAALEVFSSSSFSSSSEFEKVNAEPGLVSEDSAVLKMTRLS